MSFFLRQRLGWPTVGIALATGLLVADCLFVVGPYMGPFKAGPLWPILIGPLWMYLLLGVGIEYPEAHPHSPPEETP